MWNIEHLIGFFAKSGRTFVKTSFELPGSGYNFVAGPIKSTIMKSFSFKYTGQWMMLTLLIVTFTMCKKEKDPEPSASKRITGYTVFMKDTLIMTCDLNYSGNLVTELVMYDTTSTVEQRIIIGYSGTQITGSTEYWNEDGTMSKYSSKEITGYSGANPNGIISRYYNASGNETSAYKTIYGYDGTLLKSAEEYQVFNGSWELNKTIAYFYDNSGKIVQQADTFMNYGHIITYKYDAGHMQEALQQNYTFGVKTNNSKITYENIGSLPSNRSLYDWISGAWVKSINEDYTYNSDGTLASTRTEWTESNFKYNVIYLYGDGSGNYRECLKTIGGVMILPGEPAPYPVKSTKSLPWTSLSGDLIFAPR
jgi:hypothetical protein